MESVLVKMMRKSIEEFYDAIIKIEKLDINPILKTMLTIEISESIQDFTIEIERMKRKKNWKEIEQRTEE